VGDEKETGDQSACGNAVADPGFNKDFGKEQRQYCTQIRGGREGCKTVEIRDGERKAFQQSPQVIGS